MNERLERVLRDLLLLLLAAFVLWLAIPRYCTLVRDRKAEQDAPPKAEKFDSVPQASRAPR